MTQKFWMVMRTEPFNGTGPRVRHATWAEAAVEAQRLACKESVGFIILEAVDEVVVIHHEPTLQLQAISELIGELKSEASVFPAKAIASDKFVEPNW